MPPSVIKRQTTVTVIQILTQKWFLLQNIKDSSLNVTFEMVLSTMDNGHTSVVALKQVYATSDSQVNLNIYVQSRAINFGR
jgi:hypothetical protein